MKVFWAIVLVLVVAAGAVWLRRPASTPAAVADPAPATQVDSRAAAPSPAPPPAPEPKTPPAPIASAPAPVAPVTSPAAAAPAAPAATTLKPADAPTAEEAKAAAERAAKELSEKLAAHLDDQLPAVPAPALPPIPPTAAGAADAPHPASDKAAQTLTLVKQDDGTTLVDNRFTLAGAGTKEDPYRVSWEMLMSAQDTYQPRLGRKVIPERVKMLDGKWVKIGGYIAFPIMAQSQDEMLMMLNQWDGCCIGVPPTPYDAIEVKLKSAAKGDERFRVSGTITGVLRVDPYLVKDWLVSLYLMDDAVLTDAAGTQAPAQHSK